MSNNVEITGQVLVKELMSLDVLTVGAKATLLEACEIMCQSNQSCVVVTDNDSPIGILTERDMVRILISFLDTKTKKKLLLNSFMTTSPITIHEQRGMDDARTLFRKNKIRHLPIVNDGGNLTGILDYSQIVESDKAHADKIEVSIEEQTNDIGMVKNELLVMSLKDPLLGISKRRAMEADLNRAHDVALRYDRPYSMVLMDIDYFKKYNENYGHTKGDEALKWIGDYIQQSLRVADGLYRYGGDEFLLLLPETLEDGESIFVRRLITGLAELALPHSQSPFGYLSMSAGLVTENPSQAKDISWQQLLKRADKALYTAKQQGRNQYAVSENRNRIYAETSAVA